MSAAVVITSPSSFGAKGDLVGSGTALQQIWKSIQLVAPTNSAVLIRGETVTGKELVAKAIHEGSTRSGGPYIKVNCAAIPAGLLESELFGHERGAFTGALTQTTGRFQLAHTGTLFLDEIGDLPLELQPKLLRVLQEQEFERLGSMRTTRVDVRIVAATNQDLLQMVRERRFRADLFYRLNVFPIDLPPLRFRAEDIPLLVKNFTQGATNPLVDVNLIEFTDDAISVLNAYHWPGNLAEMFQLVSKIASTTETRVVTSEQLPLRLRELKHWPTLAEFIAGQERQYTDRVLRACRGDKAAAATVLGVDASKLG